MNFFGIHIILFYILLMLISSVLLGYIFLHKDRPGARYSMGIIGLMLFWSGMQGLEFSAQEIGNKLIFANLQYYTNYDDSDSLFISGFKFFRK
jgi:hypothetical protein